MSKYDQDYYMIVLPRQGDLNVNVFPYLTPNEDTAKLPYEYSTLPVGSHPLIFTNGGADYNERYGRTTIKQPPEVLFAGSHPVVSGSIKENLLSYEMSNVGLQPAIYIDDWGDWHEDFWFMTFFDRLDCWDRAYSDYEQAIPPIQLGGMSLFEIYQYSLDEKVLDVTPLEQRRIFQMGNSQDAFVFAHSSVASLFKRSSGTQVIPVPKFKAEY